MYKFDDVDYTDFVNEFDKKLADLGLKDKIIKALKEELKLIVEDCFSPYMFSYYENNPKELEQVIKFFLNLRNSACFSKFLSYFDYKYNMLAFCDHYDYGNNVMHQEREFIEDMYKIYVLNFILDHNIDNNIKKLIKEFDIKRWQMVKINDIDFLIENSDDIDKIFDVVNNNFENLPKRIRFDVVNNNFENLPKRIRIIEKLKLKNSEIKNSDIIKNFEISNFYYTSRQLIKTLKDNKSLNEKLKNGIICKCICYNRKNYNKKLFKICQLYEFQLDKFITIFD